MQLICPVDESITMIGRALSLDVAPDGSFLVSNGNDIIGYDSSGHQSFAWNKKGRGPSEYLVSKRVRATESTIYVWDSGSAKLLAYDMNGNGLWSYEYNSAICDFYPTDTSVFIYPCGRKWENIVEELDLRTMSIIRSFGSSSMAHKAFQAMEAAVPLTIEDGSLYYMARDKMDLFQVGLNDPEATSKVKHFSSDSFHCKDIDEDLFAINPHSGIEYVSLNSFVVSVAVDNGEYKVLTAEGAARPGKIHQSGRIKLNNNTLVYRLYKISMNSQSVSTCERLFDPALICERNGKIFLLKEDIDNETYQLVTLE